MTLDIIDMLLNSNLSYQGKLRAIYELCNKQMKEYIRFGELPEDGCSKRGNGIIGDGYECVGKEKGVSVWDCIYNFDTDLYQLVAPHPTRFTNGDFSQAYDPDNCCGCDPNEKIYVVTGIEVGYGADNAHWVAMDYGEVMVHIFTPELRTYYDLEHLWADAKLEEIPDID